MLPATSREQVAYHLAATTRDGTQQLDDWVVACFAAITMRKDQVRSNPLIKGGAMPAEIYDLARRLPEVRLDRNA